MTLQEPGWLPSTITVLMKQPPTPAHLKLLHQELVRPKIKERWPCSFSKSNAVLI